MAGFFRKVAGAFIEVERSQKERAEGKSVAAGDANLEEITRGASELLAQLETTQAREGRGRRNAPAVLDAGAVLDAAAADAAGAPTAATSGQMAGSRMGLTAEQVFAQSGLDEGPHTAPRMLRMIAGLSMFPPEQQVVMVRAMDQADDTWSEDQVLDDARRRQSVLRGHLQSVEEERAARIQELDAQIQSTQGQGQQLLEDLDRRIGELQIQREAAISDATAAVAQLEQQKKALEDQAEQSRRGITHVINALSGLMGFFGQRTAP